MNSDFNTYKIEDIIHSKDGTLYLIREVDIKEPVNLEKGETYFARFESPEPDPVPEFNR